MFIDGIPLWSVAPQLPICLTLLGSEQSHAYFTYSIVRFSIYIYIYIYVCIRTTICNLLANYDQNIESMFRLLKVCLFVKFKSSDCRIYWTESTRLNRLKIRLDQSNHVHIYFSAKFPIQHKPIWCVGFYVLLQV